MRILITTILISAYFSSLAQTAECTRVLEQAEVAFDQGRLLDVISLLNKETGTSRDCYNNFSKDEKIRAKKLLTKVYIFTDNVPEAEDALIDLLKEDKEHQLAPNDPSELHFLYSQFRTEPIFRIGGRFAANKSLPVVLQTYTTFQVGDKKYNEKGTSTGMGIGFSFEALIERHIKNGIEVAVGPQLRFASYEVEGNLLEQPGQLFYTVNNRSTMLRVPVLGRYNFNYDKKDALGNRIGKIPYLFAGFTFDFVLDAKYVSTDRTGGTAFTLSTDNSLTDLNQVNKTNMSLLAGAGLKFRMGRAKVDFLSVEFRYDHALFNYIDEDNRYQNQSVYFDIGHVEDDIRLNTISLAVGYTYSIYKPQKRKQYR